MSSLSRSRLVALGGMVSVLVGTVVAAPPPDSQSPDQLADRLSALCAEETLSYHQLLQKSSEALRNACLNKEWKEISRSLAKQKLGRINHREHQWGISYTCEVSKQAKKFVGVPPFDLFLQFETSNQTSETEPTKQVVRTCAAGLRMRAKTPYSALANSASFPEGTILRALLDHADFKATGLAYPIIESVEFTFDRIVDKNFDSVPSGFHVFASLTDKQSSSGKSLFFTAVSSLEPVRTYKGEDLQNNFIPKDVIGALQSGGSSSWSKPVEATNWYLERVDPPQMRSPPSEKPAIAFSVADLKVLSSTVEVIWVKGKTSLEPGCFTRFSKLRSLTIDGDDFGDAELAGFDALKELSILQLSGMKVSEKGLAEIAKLPKLGSLSLSYSSAVTTQGAEVLSGSTSLTELHLWWAEKLGDDGLERLSKLTRLRKLRLWGTASITDKGLQSLAKLNDLREVGFSHTKNLTKAGYASLAKLPIEIITLGYTSLNDECLEQLGKIGFLRQIWLYSESFTDKGLAHLKSLSKLEVLVLSDTKGVTAEGIEDLKSALPGKFELK